MSLGFKIYSYFNGNLVHQDSLGNKFYQDKKNPNKRWIIYADGLGPESIPTNYHNWLHNTSDVLDKNITLPSDKSLNNQDLTKIIKVLSDYVVLIKIK